MDNEHDSGGASVARPLHVVLISSLSAEFERLLFENKKLREELHVKGVHHAKGNGGRLDIGGGEPCMEVVAYPESNVVRKEHESHDSYESSSVASVTIEAPHLTSEKEIQSLAELGNDRFHIAQDHDKFWTSCRVDFTETRERRCHTRDIVRKMGRGGAIGQYVHGQNRPQTDTTSHETPLSDLEVLEQKFKISIRSLCKHLTQCGHSLPHIAEAPAFESTFAVLIFVNGIIMCFQVQYNGFDIGHKMPYTSAYDTGEETWPGAGAVFEMCTLVFGIIFTAELVFKLMSERIAFFKTAWNWFDSCVVIFWLMERSGFADLILNPNLLRLMRLLRLVRLTRMAKQVQALDSLQVLVGSIKACVSVALWAASVLLMVFVLGGFMLNAFLEEFMKNEGNPLESRQAVYKYFGTFTRCMLTMYELSLGNWVPCTRLLVEDVHEVYGGFILLFRYFVGFAMVRVITGVFLHETFQVAALDDDLMIVQRGRMLSKYQKKMMQLLKVADDSQDGVVERCEFTTALSAPRIRAWLSAMGLEVSDVDILFDFMDSGDGELRHADLVAGFTRLKGPARSIDVIGLTFKMVHLQDVLADLMERVDWLCNVSKTKEHVASL